MTEAIQRFKMPAAVYVMLRRDDEILLAQRANTGYQDGKYGLPAGHLDGKELATAGAMREAKEEVGVDIHTEDLQLTHVTHRLDTGISSERIELFFECWKWTGTPQNTEPDKCSGIGWFPVSQLPPNIIPLVRCAIELSGQGIAYSEYPVEPV